MAHGRFWMCGGSMEEYGRTIRLLISPVNTDQPVACKVAALGATGQLLLVAASGSDLATLEAQQTRAGCACIDHAVISKVVYALPAAFKSNRCTLTRLVWSVFWCLLVLYCKMHEASHGKKSCVVVVPAAWVLVDHVRLYQGTLQLVTQSHVTRLARKWSHPKPYYAALAKLGSKLALLSPALGKASSQVDPTRVEHAHQDPPGMR